MHKSFDASSQGESPMAATVSRGSARMSFR
jgi:hypothetical protein